MWAASGRADPELVRRRLLAPALLAGESMLRPFVHYDGPSGPARRGRCGTRGAVVPRLASPPSTPPKTTTAEQRLRAAVPAIEGYAADHGGYAGMTLAGLRKYDAAIVDITIVRASRNTYCIESGTGSEMFHKNGPGESSAPGPCPAA